MPTTVDFWSLIDLATPWCMHVVVTLRVAEHIAAGKGKIGELAAAAGADADALARVLRHLVEKGVFAEPRVGEFALNDVARMLMEPGARLSMDLNGFGARMALPWSHLLSAVKTGKSPYAEVFGRGFWDDMAANPAVAAEFDALMGPAGHGAPNAEVLLGGDWAGVETVVDIGGGTGALLAAVLQAHREVRGILVDAPATVARAGETFRAAAVADRVTASGQSFFDPLPAGDLYLMKNVLADWGDAEAEALLKRCAEALRRRAGSRLVILGGVSDGASAPPELLMLVLVGGKGRTVGEFEVLAGKAGLKVQRSGRLGGRFVVQCAAA